MGKKGTRRKTRWRVLPIGGEDGVCSNNEDEVEGERDSTSPTVARASGQQRTPRGAGSYYYRHRPYYQQAHEGHQPPLVTPEKRTFNEEEYTKITTPRQDVLFKKGYLGRKRLTAPAAANPPPANASSVADADAAAAEGGAAQNGEATESEQAQFVYATNGYVDQPGGLYFVNGSGYELYDPYSGNVTIVVGPAPHYGGPGGGPPVLAAVPCQPLPLQPLEWFNPAFLPYVSAPCHNGLASASARDRRKRYSTDSQNCSPQSSESTEPPGSPQECDQALFSQPAAYVYPGYMFGPPMYNVNGVTLQGAPTQPPSCDIAGSSKRRKKKRRKRRRRGGAEDGCSEESSSDEKELEEPMSLTSQESSSQEIEFDSKQTIDTIAVNDDSSLSPPLSSCQTLTPIDDTHSSAWLKPTEEQTSAFDSQTPLLVHLQKEDLSAPLAAKDISSDRKICNSKSLVEKIQHAHKQILDEAGEDTSIELLKDTTGSENFILHLNPDNSLEEKELLPYAANNKDTVMTDLQEVNIDKIENRTIGTETIIQCNGGVSNEGNTKQKKSGRHKKNVKAKEVKQKRPTKLINSDAVRKKCNKNKDENIIDNALEDQIKEKDTLNSNMDGNESKTASEIMDDGNSDSAARISKKTKSNERTPILSDWKEKQEFPSGTSSIDLSPISLRPDGPRFETKTLTSSQLKCTTDILDSITEALIKEPMLRKDNEPQIFKAQKALKGGSVVDASKLSEVPVPTPKHKTFDFIDSSSLDTADGGDVVEESSGDSTTSSTTHESEESVIELLSSTNTKSPDDKQKQILLSNDDDDDDEGVIYTKNEMMDIKSIPPDKSTPSISGPSLEESSRFSERQELLSPESVKDMHVKLYADALSKILVYEAVHEASKKKFTLPITEAVTRWLRSQSPEVLSCPSAEDESESDVSLEERAAEMGGDEKEMTGQKNVLCNPLPAPSREDYDFLCVERRGCSDVAGRRVAIIKNDSIYGNDNNEIAASLVARDKSLLSETQNKSYCTLNTNVINNYSSAPNFQTGYTTKKSNEVDSITKDCRLEFGIATTEIQMNTSYKSENVSGETRNTEKKKDEEDDLSFTSDETLECEWDHWDCNPEKPVSLKNLAKNPNSIVDGLAKSPEDHCSQNHDPAISVAKYYSLGTLQETENDCSEDETDALKHFRHEFEDEKYRNIEIYKSHYGEGGPRVCFEYDNVRKTDDRNSFVISRLKGDGPFPCGGICCILQ